MSSIPKRSLRTGVELSTLGFGGAPLGELFDPVSETEAQETLQAAWDAGIRYYEDHGFEPSGHLRYDPGPDWRDLPPGDPRRLEMGFTQEIEPLYAQIKEACSTTADGALIAGTGFRCVGILDSLEQDLDRPVLSANQVSLWHCLRLAGIEADISGYGKLLGI